jgi:SAM-dependent methyltransferase
MTTLAAPSDYVTLAPFYDRYTAHPAFRDWILGIEALSRRFGFDGGPILDAACGTGGSLEPLLARGYSLTGFDICPAMLSEARRKLGPSVRLEQADVTAAPVFGSFELITWLNDACNCLLEEGRVFRALACLEANLRPGGILVFDVSTLASFNGVFAETHVRTDDRFEFVWEGRTTETTEGGVARATLSIYDVSRRERKAPIAVSEHIQRHHPHALLAQAIADVGLVLLARLGQEPEGELTEEPRRGQPKRLYVATKPVTTNAERRNDAEGKAPRHAGRTGPGGHEARLTTGGARPDQRPGAASRRGSAR